MLFACRERILGYRDESQRLDQSSRLYDSSVSSDGFEQDASRIVQVDFWIGHLFSCELLLLMCFFCV